MLKNIVYCPAGDNILVEGRIPPSAEVPSGTQCEEENILSPAGQGGEGVVLFYRYVVPDGTKRTNIFLKH
jgi:hypothetical protein